MSEKSVGKKKEKSHKLPFNESSFKKVMDSIETIFKEDLVVYQTSPIGIKLGVNESLLEEKFPDISSDLLRKAIEFVAKFVHYVTCHEIEHFYAEFKNETKTRIDRIITIMKEHENFGLLVFRTLRRTNYIAGMVESHIKLVKFTGVQDALVKYYDISIPFIDRNGEDAVLRLEIDQLELEALVSSLVKMLEKK